MIKAGTGKRWLPLYEALASEVRLGMLELLASGPMNVKQLADATGLSSAIITMHVRKLEQAGLIRSTMVRKQRGTHKMCELAEHSIEITLPNMSTMDVKQHEVFIPIGHYSQIDAHPTCGLATVDKVIGQFDDPRYFHDPERMNAGILWIGRGFVEYQTPNYLLPGERPVEIELALEIGSEAPGVQENWPSDISFHINGVKLGVWTSPGDFGSTRGKFTPAWWMDSVNQYGLLKVVRIKNDGTYIDGQRLSDVGLDSIGLQRNHWTIRLAVEEFSDHVGGMTLYGKGFGNYDQDIFFKVSYE